MGFLGKFKEDDSIKTIEIENGYQTFSTPFQTLPDGNLSTPLVWDRYQTRNYTPFGKDNLYPQHLNQIYYTSPLHGSIVDFKVNAAVGGGYDIDDSKLTAKEKVDLYTFKTRLGLDKLCVQITEDKVIHERNYFLIKVDKRKPNVIGRIGSEKVRTNKDKTIYTVCNDWLYSRDIIEYLPYKKGVKDGNYLLCFEENSIGQDIYPLPKYTSAMNFAFLSGELSYLAKSNIQNAVFPSFAMMFPKKPQGKEEMQEIQDTVDKLKGAANAGKAVGFFANNKESLPELVNVPTNDNDKLFKEASELVTEQICFSHTIDPILLGVRTTGSLGNGSDIKQAYVIFEKNVILPLRKEIEYIFNTLLSIEGINAKLDITNYQIINEKITEVEENETVEALMALPEELRAKVLESMSQDEIRALAGLKPSETTPQIQPVQQATLNDNLKGLTAKENMDIVRIVRDYEKGKLSEAIARTRLAAYSFDAETIKEILSL